MTRLLSLAVLLALMLAPAAFAADGDPVDATDTQRSVHYLCEDKAEADEGTDCLVFVEVNFMF